jgi:hypothetical protein
VCVRVPLADLAGRAAGRAAPPPCHVSLGSGGRAASEPAFSDEDAEVAAAALRARAAAAAAGSAAEPGGGAAAAAGGGGGGGALVRSPPPLSSLSLPGSANERLGPGGVAVLVDALAGLPGLAALNGVHLDVRRRDAGGRGHYALPQPSAASRTELPAACRLCVWSRARPSCGPRAAFARPCRPRHDAQAALAAMQGRSREGPAAGAGRGGGGGGVLDLSGSACGPVVLALLLRRAGVRRAGGPAHSG